MVRGGDRTAPELINSHIFIRYMNIIGKLLNHLCFFFFSFGCMHMVAAKLQVLLHVCFLCHSALLICTCLLLGLHREDQGLRGNINLESNVQNYSIHRINSLHLSLFLVCWWSHYFPHVPHQHKPGLNAIQLIILSNVKFDFHYFCAHEIVV